MGFSVSGSFAVLVVGAFIAFGTFYGAAFDGAERVTDAQRAAYDDRLEQQNTAINITEATWDVSELTVKIVNTGSTELRVNETDILVDNEFVTHAEIESALSGSQDVDGNTETDLWLPGETLTLQIPESLLDDLGDAETPDRVKIVTGPGVADSKPVTVI